MSREVVSPGSPFSIAAYDRGFGSAPKDIIVIHSGRPDANGNATQLGQLVIGGHVELGDPTITVGAKVTNKVQTTLQLRDAAGNAFTGVRKVFLWLSAAPGGVVSPDTTNLTTTIDTGVSIAVITAGLVIEALTDATGKLVLGVDDSSGTTTRYANFEIDGRIYSSAAIVTT